MAEGVNPRDVMYGTTQPLPCGVCGVEKLPRYLEERRLWDDDSEGYYPDPYDAPVCAACRDKEDWL